MRAKRPSAHACLGLLLVTLGLGALPVLLDTRQAEAQTGGRAWFGVEVAPRKDGKSGVLVKHVIRTSPADAAGIHDGDGILRLGEKAVAQPADVINEIRLRKPGEGMDVGFDRSGHEQKAHVTLGIFPGADELLKRDKIGTFAPPLIGLSAVQGAVPATLGSLRGKVVIIDFWAGWCGACKLVTPVLNQWQSKFGAQGLVVLGITNDPVNVATKATAEFGIRYAVGADKGDANFAAYGVSSLPTMYVLDKRGVVRSVEVGFDPGGTARGEALLEMLLAEKP